jgi:hypothetical protein
VSRRRARRGLALGIALVAIAAPTATASTQYGDLSFPEDENAQPSSWDYWWGAARIVAKSGNRYIVPIAFTSLDGAMSAGYQVYPLQGPYEGEGIMSMEGPVEWGHPNDQTGRYANTMTMNAPGLPQRVQLDTLDVQNGLTPISRWERIDLSREVYRFALNQTAAKVHPGGERIPLHVNLTATMRTPLLAGGTGRWFYGVPEDYGYPSRAFQYQQGAKQLEGTIEFQQPDGTMLREKVDPKRSILTWTHESNPKEAIPIGIGLAVSSQIHARYLQSYNLQWPWELIYADLGNGAQLMFDLQAYHDTPRGIVNVNPKQPTYRVLATVRLPSGESVRLDEKLHAEHLERRTLDSIASATGETLESPWVQSWQFRVTYPGGIERAGNGEKVRVPPFDLGLAPPFTKAEPLGDAANNRLTQRVPFDVTGSYAGCPVDGFAWSELLSNWYGWEDRDPWANIGGKLPKTPKRCGAKVHQPPLAETGELDPPEEPLKPPVLANEQCTANDQVPHCEFDATGDGGIAGTGNPYGWTVTINRPGRPEPIVIQGHGGWQAYPCGTVRDGDHVVVDATPGSSVTVGNPGICI